MSESPLLTIFGINDLERFKLAYLVNLTNPQNQKYTPVRESPLLTIFGINDLERFRLAYLVNLTNPQNQAS